jgi:hypothetical protein
MAKLDPTPADRILQLVDAWLAEESPVVDGEEHAMAELIRLRAERQRVALAQRGALALSLNVALRKLHQKAVVTVAV